MANGITHGEAIRAARKRAGWGQIELANRIGTDQRTISRWENDQHVPSRRWRQALCDVFGDPEMFGDDEDDEERLELEHMVAVLMERIARLERRRAVA